MKVSISYLLGITFSLTIHGLIIAAMYAGWKAEPERVVIQPRFIDAKLVELAPKQKEIKKKKNTDANAAQRKRDSQRRRAAEKRKADALKSRQRQAELDRKEKERLAKEREEQRERAERERLAELQRQQKEQEFADAIAEEQRLVNAEKDEREANSYRQLIQQRLSENWNRPPSARRGMETMIRLQLVPTGRVVGVTVLKSSGDSAFDRSVEQAAFKADQFIELQKMSPSLFEKKFRQVDVLFSPQDLRL
ncbi:MAG: cell envelope integrity protein TolA [Porticoccaceae bacterium]|nr:cell envelope integrity protein TolA [Porticoccaceae bacterium]